MIEGLDAVASNTLAAREVRKLVEALQRFEDIDMEGSASPTAQIEKVASDLSDGDFDRGLEKLARKDDADKPVIGDIDRAAD